MLLSWHADFIVSLIRNIHSSSLVKVVLKDVVQVAKSTIWAIQECPDDLRNQSLNQRRQLEWMITGCSA